MGWFIFWVVVFLVIVGGWTMTDFNKVIDDVQEYVTEASKEE